MPSKRFCLVMVKPSHYDDDGYVIQWHRSLIPSNSLAALYGLARKCAEQHILGPDVEFELHAFDETNTRIRPAALASLIRKAGAGMVMMVGVQSNQFPRALDIAKPLREMGVQVGIGGFHVSGVISMLDGKDPDLDRASAMGLSLFAGEAEEHLGEVLLDAYAEKLKPLYNFMADLPGIESAPVPMLPAARARRTLGNFTSFDAGRGCPYQCSFCTIINVQGRKSRRRSPDDIEATVRENLAQGLSRFFITDDNFARNKDWEPILDRLIKMRRGEGLKFSIIVQVDTLCHKLPNFINKCARAGVRRVFIGLESINPDNLLAAKKRQNKITEYRKMLLEWKRVGVLTYAGYILGFPGDSPESIRRDIELIKRELPVDLLEFFYLTPLPGSEDHQKLHRAGVPMDPDMNKYDVNHVTATHPKMSKEEWEHAYRDAWTAYYTDEHVETVLRRAALTLMNLGSTMTLMATFRGSIEIEKVHPLEGGMVRMKYRRDRRPGMPIEPAWRFYPRMWWELASKGARWLRLYLRLRAIYNRVRKDPKKLQYTDLAMTPVTDDEAQTHEMFQTAEAKTYLTQVNRLEKMRNGAPAASSAG